MRHRHETKRTSSWAALVALSALSLGGAAGCVEGFDPFEQISGLRLIAFAPDKPALLPGETTTMSALLYSESGDLSEVSLVWEWCPLTSSSQDGFACGISQEQIDMIGAQSPVPIEIPRLILGAGETAELPYPLPPPFLIATCDQLKMQEIPDFVTLPECETSFPISLLLSVTHPDGTQILARKSLTLLYEPPADPAERNTNPVISGVRIAPKGTPRDQAEVLAEDGTYPVKYEESYVVYLDVEPEQAQRYTPAPEEFDPAPAPRSENLIFTYFYEGGGFENSNTIFVDGFTTLDEGTTNTFTAPRARDFDRSELEIYIVVRDERDGLGWIKRTLTVGP